MIAALARAYALDPRVVESLPLDLVAAMVDVLAPPEG